MARRKAKTVSMPTTFVGTFYDTDAGVYIASRKDGTLTVGQINKRGVNIYDGRLAPHALTDATVEH